jgi:hypothetical protein
MAPRANKTTGRARVSEKIRRVWNVREKLAVVMYFEKGNSKIKQQPNLIFKRNKFVTGCQKKINL